MRSLHNFSSAAREKEAFLSSMEHTLRVSNVTAALAVAAGFLAQNTSTSSTPRRPVSASRKGRNSTESSLPYAHGMLRPTAELSVRTCNALRKGRIMTIKQFCAIELHDLRWLRNFGGKSVEEVKAYRERLGVPMR